MSNSRLQKPGSTGVSAGISSGLLGVKTISFGDVPTAWPEDHVMRHVVVIVVSPSYSTVAPSSTHGIPRVESLLQSRSNRSRSSVNSVPSWMLPVPRVNRTRTVSPGNAKAGPPT
ncbi:MAG: hypothetical protein E6J56_01555 [Deltaproteobacteria bacterium]|nr:MAG: hypothetical protein E6J56_01555 [Deltaproteobacteria bacterium]